jgi:hypothetical protein
VRPQASTRSLVLLCAIASTACRSLPEPAPAASNGAAAVRVALRAADEPEALCGGYTVAVYQRGRFVVAAETHADRPVWLRGLPTGELELTVARTGSHGRSLARRSFEARTGELVELEIAEADLRQPPPTSARAEAFLEVFVQIGKGLLVVGYVVLRTSSIWVHLLKK